MEKNKQSEEKGQQYAGAIMHRLFSIHSPIVCHIVYVIIDS